MVITIYRHFIYYLHVYTYNLKVLTTKLDIFVCSKAVLQFCQLFTLKIAIQYKERYITTFFFDLVFLFSLFFSLPFILSLLNFHSFSPYEAFNSLLSSLLLPL